MYVSSKYEVNRPNGLGGIPGYTDRECQRSGPMREVAQKKMGEVAQLIKKSISINRKIGLSLTVRIYQMI